MNPEQLHALHAFIDTAHRRGLSFTVQVHPCSTPDEAVMIEGLADISPDIEFNEVDGDQWWTIEVPSRIGSSRVVVCDAHHIGERPAPPADRTQIDRAVPWTMPVTVAATPSTQGAWVE